MSLRLFAAIAIPTDTAARLTPLQRDVMAASWRPAENFHLTLRFFGEIDEALARDLDDEMGRIVEPPFQIRLKGAGSFGGRAPASLWIAVEAPPVLARLAASCEKSARRVGLAPERRGFTPHVTLAYCHGTADYDAAAFMERVGAFECEPFWVDHFALYSSWATRRASRYVEEAVYPLTGAPVREENERR
ncbi:MAG: RNA 2',3'-cyclic phosphodiesterase [Alphaproteobacteria bacterium]|nr:RNA 2',3'-cyclic phosphodiesterase [Alphaproteobacteria bacterium]